MRKVIIFSAILIALASPIRAKSASEHHVLLRTVALELSELNPPITFDDDAHRKELIELKMAVSSEVGDYLLPGSMNQALEWLDMALPLDLKKSLAVGPYFNPYVHSRYGSSVERDITNFFSNAWHLDARSPVCNHKIIEEKMSAEGVGCFTVLLDQLRAAYGASN